MSDSVATHSTGMPDFATRCADAVAARGRLCVGIDPHPGLLRAWGLTDDAAGLAAFAEIAVDAIGPAVAVVKPQVAFFERYGSAGVAVLEHTIAGLRSAGALVLADAKRGDIGSTMDAYAHAWLDDRSPLCSDAVTASPYLGVGALRPAVATAARTGRGVFVLARTSNPDGGELQTARVGATTVAQRIVDDAIAETGDGPVAVGLVVGATREHGLRLDGFRGPILAPGLGAQGATARDIARIFAGVTPHVLPAASRAVLAHGPQRRALADAASGVRDEVESALG